MSHQDDFVLLHMRYLGDRRFPIEDLGLDWPPPEFIVFDGEKQTTYDAIWNIIYQDGKLIYRAEHDRKYFVVMDGEAVTKGYDQIISLSVQDDHIVAIARKKQRVYQVTVPLAA